MEKSFNTNNNINFNIYSYRSDTIFINCYHDDINSNYTIKGDLKNTSKLFLNKLDKNQKTNYGSGRMVIWKNILKLILEIWKLKNS